VLQAWYGFFNALTRDASPKYKQLDISAGPISVQTELGRPVARCFVVIAGSGTLRFTHPDGDTVVLSLSEGTTRQYQFTAVENAAGTITTLEIAL